MRRWVAVAAVAVVLAEGAGTPEIGAASAPVVRGVRTIPSGRLTRLVIDCSSKVPYRLRRSADLPTRITVDLRYARLPARGLAPLSIAEGPLQSVRAVRTSEGVRLVLTARDRASAAAFPLLDPFRLVVDVNGPADQNGDASRPAAAGGGRKPALPRKPKAASRLRVVIDPGHGGKDPGALGVRGIREKDVVLAIARRLAAKMRAGGAFEPVLTRERDVYLALEERTAFANRQRADLFVSIHANASRNRRSSGVETYYLNNTNDRGTIRLAKLETGLAGTPADDRRASDVNWILSDLLQSYKVEESIELATQVQGGMVASLDHRFQAVRNLGVKSGPFFVLVGATMPCILAEVSFLTHPREGVRLAARAYQEAIAEGLLQGLRRFVENRRRASTL